MEISITRDSSTPLNEQLLNQVRHFILTGVWTPKDLLPSESELPRQLKTNRRTIRQALGNAEVPGMQSAVPDVKLSDRQARRVRRQGV